MKLLYITTVGPTMEFFAPVIRALLDRGHQVDLACNETDSSALSVYRQWNCAIYPISCSRSPLDTGNLAAIRQIRDLAERERYDIVHCHTPIAAACTRIACRKLRATGTRVFYTAHGFHFYQGAPLKNWLMYYPVEWICAFLTDVLITINQEDYALARQKLKAGLVVYVPGVGIDVEKFCISDADSKTKRRELGIPETATVLLSVGELSQRKNHGILLEATADIEALYIVIAGKGVRQKDLEKTALDLGIEKRIRLLGYRSDVAELCAMCDIFALPSLQEGLPVALMEAMASGKTAVCSRIRGNVDLLGADNPLLFDPNDVDTCRDAILRAMQCDRKVCGNENRKRILPFSVENVVDKMLALYGISTS